MRSLLVRSIFGDFQDFEIFQKKSVFGNFGEVLRTQEWRKFDLFCFFADFQNFGKLLIYAVRAGL